MNNKIEPSDITVVWALVMKLKDRALFAIKITIRCVLCLERRFKQITTNPIPRTATSQAHHRRLREADQAQHR